MTCRYETINRSAQVKLHQPLKFARNWRPQLLMCHILLVIVKAANSVWCLVPEGSLQINPLLQHNTCYNSLNQMHIANDNAPCNM
jgi:hypothetical protein